MKYVLLWVVLVLNPQTGAPHVAPVPESTTFTSEASCKEFGTKMESRLADWVRGRIGADWDFPVGVRYECKLDGDPA